MPNWVENSIRVAGNTKQVLNFLNEGLKNSNIEPKDNVMDAFNTLKEGAKTREMGNRIGSIGVIDKLTMGTFFRVPDTILMYDTTNAKLKRDSTSWDKDRTPMFNSDEEFEAYSKAYDEAVEEQRIKYGAVGWYDYNCRFFGTKWNAELESFSIEVNEDVDEVTLSFDMQTAWSMPTEWLHWIKYTFQVNVFYLSFEESNAFNCYGEVDYEAYDAGDFSDVEGAPNEADFEGDEDAYYDACWSFQDDCKEEMYGDFDNFVREYELDDPEDIAEATLDVEVTIG